jgi:hypothetical protein
VGASHQTGWTALVTECLTSVARAREAGADAVTIEARPSRPQQPHPATTP